jgi:DNA polymerase-1
MKERIAVVDYETEKIEDRPSYPPKPVGVAIYSPDGKKKYMAWGHPTENNCTKQQAIKILKDLYRTCTVVFHNAKFDIEVGMEHMGLPFPKKYHDTLFLAYLHDPRDPSLALKPLADKYLDMPPDEQTKLKDWIIENISKAKKKPSSWGEYIALAPGKLVGRYAIGDVVRTKKLLNLFYDYIVGTDMLEAYNRELKLLPIVLEMEKTGIRVATNRLKRDINKWDKELVDLEKKIKRKLKVSPIDEDFETFNISSGRQLAKKLDAAGLITEWEYTTPSKTFPEGQKSTKKEFLLRACNDKTLGTMLVRYADLEHYVQNFAIPWIERSEVSGGYILPTFNQVRLSNEYGQGGGGTKTGRFSSTRPNLQNVPRNVKDPTMPNMRDYLIPDEGGVFIGRDYSQQEVRILAHYEDGLLLQQYLENPNLDVHDFAGDLIYEKTGIRFERKDVKITGFGLIYGMGVQKLADSMGCSLETAKQLRNAYLNSIPGIKDLNKGLRECAEADEPIRTWGGRLYYVEEPKLIHGRMMSFEYKLLNLLIQGSAADCTKQAMINVYENCDSRIVVQVHDELINCADKGTEAKEMKLMREAMEDVKFDLPMLSEGKMSKRSWSAMKAWEGTR